MLIIQCISGFTQNEGGWNGVLELSEKIRATLNDYWSLSVRIRYDVWNTNWKHVARHLYLLKQRYPEKSPFVVIVFAYSWGVGNGLVKLAKYLDYYDITINIVVISDGIYRHWFTLGNWRAIIGKWEIILPKNILEVQGFNQGRFRPMGQKPIHKNITFWKTLKRPHVEMDDALEWHNLCLKVAVEQAALAVISPKKTPVGSLETVATDVRAKQSQHLPSSVLAQKG